MPLDAIFGLVVGASAAMGAALSEMFRALARLIRGINITYTPI